MPYFYFFFFWPENVQYAESELPVGTGMPDIPAQNIWIKPKSAEEGKRELAKPSPAENTVFATS